MVSTRFPLLIGMCSLLCPPQNKVGAITSITILHVQFRNAAAYARCS
jgi:hypothetical protein